MRESGGRSPTGVCSALIDENRSMSSVAFSATCAVCPCRMENRPSCRFTSCMPTCTRHVKHGGPYNRICDFSTDSGCRDRALLVLGPNTAKQAALTALLDPSTHSRPPLTHTSHHRPALVDLCRFIAVSGVTHSRFRRFSTCVSAVSGVSLAGVSLVVAVVRPEVISQRVLIPRGRTRAHWKALVEAHTIVQ